MTMAWLLALYRKSPIGRALLALPRSVFRSAIAPCLSDEAWCRTMFAWAHGCPPDLENPQTLNEKIQWLKLYNRRPDFARWADKYAVRDLISHALGEQYLVPLLAVADDPRRIDFAALARPFIVKPNHSSGQTLVVRHETGVHWPSVVRQCRGWLKTNLYREGREWQYKDIPPKIMVERLLLDEDGNIPLDYKCHCIHGEVVAIQVDLDRYANHRRNFYDANWSRLPFTWSVCAGDRPMWPQGRDVEKPDALPTVICMSEQLARKFPYVRVDWYIVGGRVYFGEVTFHHGGGYERILPVEWDARLGAMLKLPARRPQLTL